MRCYAGTQTFTPNWALLLAPYSIQTGVEKNTYDQNANIINAEWRNSKQPARTKEFTSKEGRTTSA